MLKNLKPDRLQTGILLLSVAWVALAGPLLAQTEPHPEDDTKLPLEIRKQAQEILKRLGFELDVIDGELGIETRKALRRYQRKSKIRITGMLDETTLKRLLSEKKGP